MNIISNAARAAAGAAAIAASLTLVVATSTAASAAARPPEPATAKADVRYCTIDEIGGSRFTKRTCKTREAWVKDENFDPVAFMAAQKK